MVFFCNCTFIVIVANGSNTLDEYFCINWNVLSGIGWNTGSNKLENESFKLWFSYQKKQLIFKQCKAPKSIVMKACSTLYLDRSEISQNISVIDFFSKMFNPVKLVFFFKFPIWCTKVIYIITPIILGSYPSSVSLIMSQISIFRAQSSVCKDPSVARSVIED